MNGERFDIKWVGYNQHANKVWGWYVDRSRAPSGLFPGSIMRFNDSFCFWAVVGKTISINKHTTHGWKMNTLRDGKIKNGYAEISPGRLLEMWPGFTDDLSDRMVYEFLKGDI